jgi:hypothetical protein
MRAIFIDAKKRTISEIHLDPRNDLLTQCQKLLNGYLEIGLRMEDQHTLYVDEEGQLKNLKDGFLVDGCRFPLLGNGLILGREDRNGDATISVMDVSRRILFFSLTINRD